MRMRRLGLALLGALALLIAPAAAHAASTRVTLRVRGQGTVIASRPGGHVTVCTSTCSFTMPRETHLTSYDLYANPGVGRAAWSSTTRWKTYFASWDGCPKSDVLPMTCVLQHLGFAQVTIEAVFKPRPTLTATAPSNGHITWAEPYVPIWVPSAHSVTERSFYTNERTSLYCPRSRCSVRPLTAGPTEVDVTADAPTDPAADYDWVVGSISGCSSTLGVGEISASCRVKLRPGKVSRVSAQFTRQALGGFHTLSLPAR